MVALISLWASSAAAHGSVSGHTRDAQGERLGGIKLILRSWPHLETRIEGSSNGDGAYIFRGLADGRYFVEAFHVDANERTVYEGGSVVVSIDGGSAAVNVDVVVVMKPKPDYKERRNAAINPAAITFAVVQGLDAHSSHLARSRGHAEGNVLLNLPTGGQIATKAAMTAGVFYLAKTIERKRPTAAKVFLYGIAAAQAGIVINNYRIARR